MALALALALPRLAAVFLIFAAQVACERGMVHVVPETGGPRGKDYCILYNPQWAHLPQDLSEASLLQLRDWTASVLCLPSDLPTKGFSNQILLVAGGNCTFYEKVKLAQGGGARGLLVVSKERLVPPGGNKAQYDEIGIPVALLSYKDVQDIFRSFGHAVRVALFAPHEPMLDYSMVVIFITAVGTVALGGYWAGARDVKKRNRKREGGDRPGKQEDEAVDVDPVIICVSVVPCCFVLALVYLFDGQFAFAITGTLCLVISSTSLYSCLSPLVQRLQFCTCRLPYCHKCYQVHKLLVALLCVAVGVVWLVILNKNQWAWILQDVLGVAICLSVLKTIRLSNFVGCVVLILGLLAYDVFVFIITPAMTKRPDRIMVQAVTQPRDSPAPEKLPLVLKVPRWNASLLALCDWPFSLLGFEYILLPGLLVAYCHRFDVQVQSSKAYFVASTVAYGIGLLVTFMFPDLRQYGHVLLLYLLYWMLTTSCALALWRREAGVFCMSSGFAVDTRTYLSLLGHRLPRPAGRQPQRDSDTGPSQQPPGKDPAERPLPAEQPPEPSAPEEVGAGAPTQDPTSPPSRTPDPMGLLGASA